VPRKTQQEKPTILAFYISNIDAPSSSTLPAFFLPQATYRAGSLANTIVHHLINSGFSSLYAHLADVLPDLIERPGLSWIENCAQERFLVLKRYATDQAPTRTLDW
jgi:hypothetical protein